MDEISLVEQRKYQKMWELDTYRSSSPGLKLSKLFLKGIKPLLHEGQSLIDFGAGTGKAATPFINAGLNVEMVDIAPNCLDEGVKNLLHLFSHRLNFTCASLWDLPKTLKPAEWIYCCDVLEHLPEEKINAAFKEMSRRTLVGGVFQIYLQDEPFGDLIDDKLHLTIRPREWWIHKIAKYWPIWMVSPPLKNHVRLACIVGKGYEAN